MLGDGLGLTVGLGDGVAQVHVGAGVGTGGDSVGVDSVFAGPGAAGFGAEFALCTAAGTTGGVTGLTALVEGRGFTVVPGSEAGDPPPPVRASMLLEIAK